MEKNQHQFAEVLTVTEDLKKGKKTKAKQTSFAEQYLETPVMKGNFEHNAKITITTCTFRNIPTIDDF